MTALLECSEMSQKFLEVTLMFSKVLNKIQSRSLRPHTLSALHGLKNFSLGQFGHNFLFLETTYF